MIRLKSEYHLSLKLFFEIAITNLPLPKVCKSLTVPILFVMSTSITLLSSRPAVSMRRVLF